MDEATETLLKTIKRHQLTFEEIAQLPGGQDFQAIYDLADGLFQGNPITVAVALGALRQSAQTA